MTKELKVYIIADGLWMKLKKVRNIYKKIMKKKLKLLDKVY